VLMERSRDYYERDVLDFRQNVGFPFWARSAVSFEHDVPPSVIPRPMLVLRPSGVPGARASEGTMAMA
jgi:hypothetical protein